MKKNTIGILTTIIRNFTEAVLLAVVCFILFFWFQFSGIDKATTDDTSKYTYSKWLANDHFKSNTLPKINLESLCRHSSTQAELSDDEKTRCQSNYPDSLTLLELKGKLGLVGLIKNKGTTPPIEEPLSQSKIDKQIQDSYANLQTGFQQVVKQAPHIPPNINAFIFEDLHLRQSGSMHLECSWYVINNLQQAQNITQTQANILRTELLTGGYAPYNRFSDFRTVSADNSVGIMILPTSWEGMSNTPAVETCSSFSDSPAKLYLTTMKDIQNMYMYRDFKPKTAKLNILTDNANLYFIYLAIVSYISLLILRLKIPFLIRYSIISVIWFGNYIVINKFIIPNLIGMGMVKWLTILIGIIGILYIIYRNKIVNDDKTYSFTHVSSISVVSYPLLVLLTGVGYFVLFDWSINSGYMSNLYLALYQSEYIFIFFAFISISGLLYELLFYLIQSIWVVFRHYRNIFTSGINKVKRSKDNAVVKLSKLNIIVSLIGLVLLLVIIIFVAFTLPNQLVSVLTRTALVFLIAYFLSQSLARQQYKLFSETNFLIVFTIGLALAIQAVSLDFGPIMILSYALLILLITEIAVRKLSTGYFFINHKKSFGQFRQLPIKKQLVYLGGLFIVSLIAVIALRWGFYVLASNGSFRSVERVISMNVPFSSTNDQRAILLYFIDAVPPGGYGLGNTAWQGDFRGVPAQTQSDYYPMALYGVLGSSKLILLIMLYIVFLLSLCLPRIKATGALPINKSPHQEVTNFYAWATLIWAFFILTQITLSIMGNFGLTPLTGITLPLFSYGKVELIISGVLIGLFLQRVVVK